MDIKINKMKQKDKNYISYLMNNLLEEVEEDLDLEVEVDLYLEEDLSEVIDLEEVLEEIEVEIEEVNKYG